MSALAESFSPPYYAVIFSSVRTPSDAAEYAAAADRMEFLARQQSGFLGVESARDSAGVGITVSYWTDSESIRAWREHAEHTVIRAIGRERWYSEYRLRVCKVERELAWPLVEPGESFTTD